MAGLKERLGRLASPGTMLGMLALCVALSGTALAAATIGSSDVINNSLRGIDVKDKSLTKRDFRGSVRGPRGLRGPRGATGAAGATSVVTRVGTPTQINGGGNYGSATVQCNQGERATGGGLRVAEFHGLPVTGGDGQMNESHPLPEAAGSTPTGWEVQYTSGTITVNVAAYVICASP